MVNSRSPARVRKRPELTHDEVAVRPQKRSRRSTSSTSSLTTATNSNDADKISLESTVRAIVQNFQLSRQEVRSSMEMLRKLWSKQADGALRVPCFFSQFGEMADRIKKHILDIADRKSQQGLRSLESRSFWQLGLSDSFGLFGPAGCYSQRFLWALFRLDEIFDTAEDAVAALKQARELRQEKRLAKRNVHAKMDWSPADVTTAWAIGRKELEALVGARSATVDQQRRLRELLQKEGNGSEQDNQSAQEQRDKIDIEQLDGHEQQGKKHEDAQHEGDADQQPPGHGQDNQDVPGLEFQDSTRQQNGMKNVAQASQERRSRPLWLDPALLESGTHVQGNGRWEAGDGSPIRGRQRAAMRFRSSSCSGTIVEAAHPSSLHRGRRSRSIEIGRGLRVLPEKSPADDSIFGQSAPIFDEGDGRLSGYSFHLPFALRLSNLTSQPNNHFTPTAASRHHSPDSLRQRHGLTDRQPDASSIIKFGAAPDSLSFNDNDDNVDDNDDNVNDNDDNDTVFQPQFGDSSPFQPSLDNLFRSQDQSTPLPMPPVRNPKGPSHNAPSKQPPSDLQTPPTTSPSEEALSAWLNDFAPVVTRTTVRDLVNAIRQDAVVPSVALIRPVDEEEHWKLAHVDKKNQVALYFLANEKGGDVNAHRAANAVLKAANEVHSADTRASHMPRVSVLPTTIPVAMRVVGEVVMVIAATILSFCQELPQTFRFTPHICTHLIEAHYDFTVAGITCNDHAQAVVDYFNIPSGSELCTTLTSRFEGLSHSSAAQQSDCLGKIQHYTKCLGYYLEWSQPSVRALTYIARDTPYLEQFLGNFQKHRQAAKDRKLATLQSEITTFENSVSGLRNASIISDEGASLRDQFVRHLEKLRQQRVQVDSESFDDLVALHDRCVAIVSYFNGLEHDCREHRERTRASLRTLRETLDSKWMQPDDF